MIDGHDGHNPGPGNNQIINILIELKERVAKLEARAEILANDQDKFIDKIDHTNQKIDSLIREFEKYKGKIGGIVLAVSVLATAIINIVKLLTYYWNSIASSLFWPNKGP